MKTNVFIKKIDIIVVLAIVLFFFLVYFSRPSSKNDLLAHIIIDNKEFSVINLMELDEKSYIDLPTNPKIKLEAGHGYIGVLEAECPDKLCVLTGRLTRGGDMAVCLPARLVIQVKSENGKAEYDAIAY